MASPPEKLVRASELFRDTIWDQADRSFRLWGEVPPGPRVAIVGSRRASAQGLLTARKVAKELACAGVTVVSGGALGVDRAAHEGALEAGGKTLVMAPSGLDAPFPRQHYELFCKIIAAGGGLLTHCLAGKKASRAEFLRRNAQMVAISDCLVLGEFPIRSGSRNTWSHARRAGKPIFVLPSQFGEQASEGSLQALESSETIALGRTDSILEFLADFRHFSFDKKGDNSPVSRGSVAINKTQANFLKAWAMGYLSGVELQVFQAVLAGARTPEEVAENLELSPLTYQAAHVRLQLEGCLGEDSNGHLCVLNPRQGR